MNLHKVLGKIQFYPFLFFICLASIIIFSWFRFGLFYGGGDVGLSTYAPKRVLELASSPWWSETAPGFPRPQNLTVIPDQVLLALLEQLGLPYFMIQALTFWILIFLMGIGVYILALEFFGSDKKMMATFAGFFYVVNPYMMVLVWHRFVHGTFFLAAALPFLLLFWKRWVSERKINALIIFLCLNFLFSYMFSTLAYVLTIWATLFIYTLFVMFVPWQGWKKGSSTFAYFIFGWIMWLLTNSWWLLPVLFISPSVVSVQHSLTSNLATLLAISKQSIIPYVLPGLNSFYLFEIQELGDYFKNPLFLLIPYLGLFFIFLGIYQARKESKLIFWVALFILIIFFAKGAAQPFGYAFVYLFKKIFFLGLIRNPLEKIGILIPLAGGILFSLGFYNATQFFFKKNILLGKAIILLMFGLFFVIYHWPFWTGTVFGTPEKPNFVVVPDYYREANKWIGDQKKEGNILHLPLVIGESSTYRWEYGYSGAESNVDFFTSNPSISMGFNISYIDDALRGFDLMARLEKPDPEYFKNLLRAFNVRFLVLHNDLNWQSSNTQSIKKITAILNSSNFIRKQKDFGELTIYEIDEKVFQDKIYLTSNFTYLEQNNYKYNEWSWFLEKGQDSMFLSITPKDIDFIDLPFNKSIIIPSGSIKISARSSVSAETALGKLPVIRFMPNSLFYPLIVFKEFIENLGFQESGVNPDIEYASKRLVEAYQTQGKSPDKSISKILERYQKHLDRAVKKILKDYLITGGEVPVYLRSIFENQEAVLGGIANRGNEGEKELISQVQEELKQKMIDLNILSVFNSKLEGDLGNSRQIYKFFIPNDGEYELLQTNSDVSSIYQGHKSKSTFQVDNNVISQEAKFRDNFISYGNLFLKRGEHEISFSMDLSNNLIKDELKDKNQEIEITSDQHVPKSYQIQMDHFNPNSTYLLSFDYWTQKGNEPSVHTFEDSDIFNLKTAELIHQYTGSIGSDSYNRYWRTYKVIISPRNNSSKLSFQIAVSSWNDCKILVKKELCNKPEIKYQFERPSTVIVRNIQARRVLDNPLFLRSNVEKDISTPSGNSVTFQKKSPLFYEGTISIKNPAFLVFSETFNKDWELILYDEKHEYRPSQHFFADIYGNGWYIKEIGDFKFKLKFFGQKHFNNGILISSISLLTLVSVVLLRNLYKKRI